MNDKHGSILIMMLILMTAIMAIACSMLSISSYYLLLTREREKYEKQYQSTQK